MIKKLKTLKQIKEEAKVAGGGVRENPFETHIDITIRNKNYCWLINSAMKKYFGTEIQVRKLEDSFNYDYYCYNKWYYHESWFEGKNMIDFIEEDEFEV